MGTALLVIDMQLGVFMRKEYDGKAIYQEEQLLQNVSGLIDKARNSENNRFTWNLLKNKK